MNRMNPLPTWAVLLFATVLGLSIAATDVAGPFGDDSAQFTVLLWLVASGVLGYARPGRPWSWALAVGPWLPLTQLVRDLLRWPDSLQPATARTILILVPFSIAVCLVGAYGGALARRLGGQRRCGMRA
jgi:hypothetical protein